MRYFLIPTLAAAFAVCGAVAEEARTTVEDRTDVNVTVYSAGLGLVRDVRAVSLPTGGVELEFVDVAGEIRPETVGLRSLTSEDSVAVLEQNYEYDLMSPRKLMEKYVGEEVRLVSFSEDLGFESVDARLLSVNEGEVYEVDGEIYLGHPGNVVLPSVPENLYSRPTLVWLLENEIAQQELELTYLTRGITWEADYVINLARDDRSMELAGWITLDNRSGAAYENAQLKLVAGEPHIVQPRAPQRDMLMQRTAAAEAAAVAMPEQEAFAEYHLYTMPRRTTIGENQKKQLALLDAANIVCEKTYELRGRQEYFFSRYQQREDTLRPTVHLTFKNEEGNNLGMPLPEGTMRVYQEDSEGMLLFAGEDRIQHTPRDEEVRIRMGDAFDVVGERVQTEFDRIANNVWESAFEITLRNHKDSAVDVDIVENLPGDWSMVENSHDFERRDAYTAVFPVEVPARGEVTVEYRIRVRR